MQEIISKRAEVPLKNSVSVNLVMAKSKVVFKTEKGRVYQGNGKPRFSPHVFLWRKCNFFSCWEFRFKCINQNTVHNTVNRWMWRESNSFCSPLLPVILFQWVGPKYFHMYLRIVSRLVWISSPSSVCPVLIGNLAGTLHTQLCMQKKLREIMSRNWVRH